MEYDFGWQPEQTAEHHFSVFPGKLFPVELDEFPQRALIQTLEC